MVNKLQNIILYGIHRLAQFGCVVVAMLSYLFFQVLVQLFFHNLLSDVLPRCDMDFRTIPQLHPQQGNQVFGIGMNGADAHIVDQAHKLQIIYIAGEQIEVVEILLDFLLHLIGRIVGKGDHHNAIGHLLHIAALCPTKKTDAGNHGICFSGTGAGPDQNIFRCFCVLYLILLPVKGAVLADLMETPVFLFPFCLAIGHTKRRNISAEPIIGQADQTVKDPIF